MFHNKHHLKLWDKSHYIDLFNRLENCYTQDVDRYGWLLNFINLVSKKKLAKKLNINDFNLLVFF